MGDLTQLAALLRAKNEIEAKITDLIGRPALIGHVGEYIAAQIFDIQLEDSASRKSIDGFFRSGPLAGKSVNIKWYAKQQGVLDITPGALPDTYLVLSGPTSPASSSRGTARPWLIDHVYLFQADILVAQLRLQGVKIGTATSLSCSFWQAAEIYPEGRNPILPINPSIRQQLALFGSNGGRFFPRRKIRQ